VRRSLDLILSDVVGLVGYGSDVVIGVDQGMQRSWNDRVPPVILLLGLSRHSNCGHKHR